MLVLNERGKTIDVSLDPEFFKDLGQLIQIVFPKYLQSFITSKGLICILESNRKLLSLKNPVEGVFRAFNNVAESFPERYSPEQVLFTVQPMTMEEFQIEQKEKELKMLEKMAKKPAVVPMPPPPQPVDEAQQWRDIEAWLQPAPANPPVVGFGPAPVRNEAFIRAVERAPRPAPRGIRR